MGTRTADVGTGSTITLATSAWESQVEILSMEWSGISRESLETTHLATAAATSTEFGTRTFIPGAMQDPGEITFEFNFDPNLTKHPINESASPELLTVSFNNTAGTSATWAGLAFCTDYSMSVPLEGIMTGSATFKFTDEITMTAGA